MTIDGARVWGTSRSASSLEFVSTRLLLLLSLATGVMILAAFAVQVLLLT